MKNQFTSRIVKLTFAFMFILIASSCSEDNDAMDAAVLANEINSELLAKANTKVSTQSTLKTTTVTLADCSAGCITDRVLFEDNTNDQVGSSPNYKNVNYQIWNTSTQLIVQTTNNYATDKVEIVVNGETYTNDPLSDIAAGQFFFTYFDLPEGYNACEYTLTSVKVFGGPQAELTGINYGVYEYCSSCTITDEEFSGAAVSCGTSREANFTFGSEDGVDYFKIQGGLTNFTVADAVVTLYNEADEVISVGYTVNQWTPGGSSNRVISVEGDDLGSCSSIRVNIKWDSTNSDDVIAGAWSVKDADGVEYAPDVAGLECL
jgi:hypothetical protein